MKKDKTSELESVKLISDEIEIVIEGKVNEDLNDNVGVKSQTESKTKDDIQDITSFIPNGWNISEKCDGELAIVEGDLNKDGIIDKAFVIEEDIQLEIDPQRNLIIAFGNEDSTYTLSIRAERAIMLRYEGGGFGDPFDDIIIDRGSLLLKFFGGSSERWYMNYRFRYQNDGWYLIGATEGSFVEIDNAMDNIEEDYNLITGDYIIRKIEDGEIITIKGNRDKKELLNLIDFDVDLYKQQL